MTKFVKMSLAAAVAVAGFNTAASAGSLEEAIKGVESSGYVEYRKEYKSDDNGKIADINEYNVNLTLTSKVNDIVSATVSAGFDEEQTKNTGSTGTETSSPYAQDADPTIKVSNAYFTFNTGVASILVGKQAIPSVFVDQSDTAKTGNGIVVLAPVSEALTVAAAHFTTNNISSIFGGEKGINVDVNTDGDKEDTIEARDTKTSEILAAGKAGVVSYDVHYNMTDASYLYKGIEADLFYAKVDVAAGPVTVSAKHAQASADTGTAGVTFADSSVSSLGVAAKVSTLKFGATYFTADKEQGTNTAQSDVAIDGDNDAKAHVKLWQLSTSAITNKGNGFVVSAGMSFTDTISASVAYGAATNDGIATAATTSAAHYDTDYSEYLVKADYKMSKNFLIHARYSVLNKENKMPGEKDIDTSYSRIQVKYTF